MPVTSRGRTVFGKELILDLQECNPAHFTRRAIEDYLRTLCAKIIHMVREDLYFWDYLSDPEAYDQEPDHLKGISAIQFIRTSNITIHTLDELKSVYINIFSCKDFDAGRAAAYSAEFFAGTIIQQKVISRT